MKRNQEKMRKVLERCPACGGTLEVTRLSCRSCDTVIQGAFGLCSFCKLPPDSLTFLEIFVKNRGNLKEMERELGQSYPTLRGRLNAIIAEMGFEVKSADGGEEDLATQRRGILERLDSGEIGAAQAAELLAGLRPEDQ
jgi:hypothetical protein